MIDCNMMTFIARNQVHSHDYTSPRFNLRPIVPNLVWHEPHSHHQH